jgi:hypothetical protein
MLPFSALASSHEVMTPGLGLHMPRAHFAHPWFKEIDYWDIEKRLRTDEIVGDPIPIEEFFSRSGKTPAGKSRAGIYIVRLKSGIWSVWKKGMARVSDGENYGYLLAQRVGFKLVPPTVEREIAGEAGSLQYFIPSIRSREDSHLADSSAT